MAKYRRRYKRARRKYRTLKRRVRRAFRRRARTGRRRSYRRGLYNTGNIKPRSSKYFTSIYRTTENLDLQGISDQAVVATLSRAPFTTNEKFAQLADMFRFYRIRKVYLTIRPPAAVAVANTVPFGYTSNVSDGTTTYTGTYFASVNSNSGLDNTEDFLWAYDPLDKDDPMKIDTYDKLLEHPKLKRRRFYSKYFTIAWTPNIMEGFISSDGVSATNVTRIRPIYKPWLRTSARESGGADPQPPAHNGIVMRMPGSQRLTQVRCSFTYVIDFKEQLPEMDYWRPDV